MLPQPGGKCDRYAPYAHMPRGRVALAIIGGHREADVVLIHDSGK